MKLTVCRLDNFVTPHKVTEHHNWSDKVNQGNLPPNLGELRECATFQGNKDKRCFEVFQNGEHQKVKTSYYIGVDWLSEGSHALQVEPKIDSGSKKTDFLGMLSSAMRHPDVAEHASKLYDIHFDKPPIEIEQKDDYLTPLLIIHYVGLLKKIVRKGLKKSYYKVEQNLNAKVKGKVLVAQTIKQNLVKNQPLKTYCSFDEFGVDGIENRILKKALLFGKRYIKTFGLTLNSDDVNYVSPAFEKVSTDVQLRELKHGKTNAFYKEYEQGLKLARLILRRFGYNINSIEHSQKISTPPFWIDMSLLFELYVLGLLKDRFGQKVDYHFTRKYNELDYLLNATGYQMVVDAKYKPKYKNTYGIDDIRQLSGYSRLDAVYESLNIKYTQSIDCLIIYVNQDIGLKDLKEAEFKCDPIGTFEGFFKVGVQLPIQDNETKP
jgi:5-methylcytosine-specific restriction enzyme subunit McrC